MNSLNEKNSYPSFYKLRAFSIRRSGMNQIIATNTYNRKAKIEFTKASGIATA
jgi:hypothetical protein